MPLMFLNGGAMRGGPLHHLLHDAPLVAIVRTAPRYRFYSAGDRFPVLVERDPKITGPSDENPAVKRLAGGGAANGGVAIGSVPLGGVAVSGELYDVPWDVLRESLLPAEPEELELGVIELEDGSGALAMVRRRTFREPDVAYRDISEHADWRAYMASLGVASTAVTSMGE